MWEWKTKKVRNLPEQVAYNTERLNELQDGDTWTAIKELRLRILNIEGSYQDKSEKNMPNGYAGLNANGEIEANRILNAVYPIGSIYMSVNSVSPATLFGGTWERIQDRFLLAAGNTYAAGTTGGEANHKHGLNSGYAAIDYAYLYQSRYGISQRKKAQNFSATQITTSGMSSVVSDGLVTGGATELGGTTDNASNMPPFLTVNIWKRTE
jgi:hypothetical protein